MVVTVQKTVRLALSNKAQPDAMDYSRFTTEDFLLDEHFQQWVYKPDPSSERFWKQFLEQHPEQALAITEARTQLKALRFHETPVDASMQSRIRGKLEEHTQISSTKSLVVQLRGSQHWVQFAVAACGLLLLVAGIIFFTGRTPTLEYNTAYAETQEVQLPDGTLVTLNANSSLSADNDPTAPLREVRLSGEAFFEVAEDATRPFIVYANTMKVRVTGTSFNVTTRSEKTEVVLATGHVILESSDLAEPISMEPGDWVAYHEGNRDLQQQKVVTDQYTAWRDRVYYFQEASLAEVAAFIENYYGQKVQLEGRLSKLTFTAKVTLAPQVDDLLILLTETFDLAIEANQENITIKKAQKEPV